MGLCECHQAQVQVERRRGQRPQIQRGMERGVLLAEGDEGDEGPRRRSHGLVYFEGGRMMTLAPWVWGVCLVSGVWCPVSGVFGEEKGIQRSLMSRAAMRDNTLL